MIKDPNIRKSIIASVTASLLFFAVIEPALSFFGEFLAWVSDNTYKGLSNWLYTRAALGLEGRIEFTILILITGINLGAFTGLAAFSSLRARQINQAKRTTPKYSNNTVALERQINRLITLNVSAVAIMFLVIVFVLTSSYAIIETNTSFNQRLAAISPHIDNQKEKEFRAEWALMTNRDDYLAIMRNMEEIAKSKDFELPELRWD